MVALSLNFGWQELKALQVVQITSPATFGSSIVQVTQLTQLMNFHLLSFSPGSTMTATYAALGRLAFQAVAHGRCDD